MAPRKATARASRARFALALHRELFAADEVDEEAALAGIAPDPADSTVAWLANVDEVLHEATLKRPADVAVSLARQTRRAHRTSESLARGNAVHAAHLSRSAVVTAMTSASAKLTDRLVSQGEREVWRILTEVPDPEIPVLNIVDLGIVRHVVSKTGGSRLVCHRPTRDVLRRRSSATPSSRTCRPKVTSTRRWSPCCRRHGPATG